MEHLEIAYTYYLIISRVRNPGRDYLGPLLKVSHDCIQTVMLAGPSSQLLLGVLFSGSLVIVKTFSLCNCKMEVTAFLVAVEWSHSEFLEDAFRALT